MEKNKKIISQMFDVRPVDKTGNLDLEKIKKIEKILRIEERKASPVFSSKKSIKVMTDIKNPDASFYDKPSGVISEDKLYSKYYGVPLIYNPKKNTDEEVDWKEEIGSLDEYLKPDARYFDNFKAPKIEKRTGDVGIKISGLFREKKFEYAFGILSFAIVFVIFTLSFVGKGIETKNSVLANGQSAFANLTSAKEEIIKNNFQKSSDEFNEAYQKFEKISQDINHFGGILLESGRFVPFLSKLSSGKYMTEAGKDISQIGILATEILENMNSIKSPLDNNESISFLDIFKKSNKNLEEIIRISDSLENNLDKINIEDIPENKKAEFSKLKSSLPEIKGLASGFIEDSQIITDVLGGNGPRKYLFLFQNNNEMRPTGGFIGSYGVLDIFDGRVRSFFVDGIFNPDGQLREKVVPPAPIQKISAAWSLHDSNWFPDFPASAEKARWFYEKTGGPTVDGVIAMTPVILQKLLGVTGPIDMPEYGVTIDENNFMEKVQEEVEVNYDKELNQPKKILSDLAPKILDKIFNARNFSDMAKTMGILTESLNEKQILIYANNYEIQNLISEKGWSGEILDTEKDYLSVINTNINGYKTDGVVDEKIEHSAEIQADGTIIDEVSITRHHNGGQSDYEWFNKVNSDYMRVYVPKGSILLSVEGQTREYTSPPLDYNSLNFKRDPQVEMEEQAALIDEKSGTRIYNDSGKTVFGNWIYVSPQETVTIKYRYMLPFKIKLDSENKSIDTYALLAQKQSGSLGSELKSKIMIPEKYKVIWKYPDAITSVSNGNAKNLEFIGKLNQDKFLGLALSLEDYK